MRLTSFRGLAPRYDTHNRDIKYATVAENVRLYKNRIDPLEGVRWLPESVVDVHGNAITGPIKTLYVAGDVKVGFTNEVSVVPDTQKRAGQTSFIYAENGKLWRTSGEWILCKKAPVPVGICAPALSAEVVIMEGSGCSNLGGPWGEASPYSPSIRMGSAGRIFAITDGPIDPAATVGISGCNGSVVAYAYPSSGPGHEGALKDCDGNIYAYAATVTQVEGLPPDIPGTVSAASCEAVEWADAIAPTPTAWVFTYITEDGQESAPSKPTDIMDLAWNDAAVLMPNDTPPAHAIYRRWYRSISGSNGDFAWAFVGQTLIGAAIDTFTDDLCPLETQELNNTRSHFPPPCVDGVALVGDTTTLVWSGRDIWLSEPRLPHAYKPINRKTVLHDIVVVKDFISAFEGGDTFQAVVLTKGKHYLLYGPRAEVITVKEFEAEHPALSARGAVAYEGGVSFVTRAGIARIQGNSFDLLIDEFVTRREWPNEPIETMQLGYGNGELVGFTTNGGFMLSTQPSSKEQPLDLTTHTVLSDACFARVEDGLYVYRGGRIGLWAQGDPLVARWRSAEETNAGLVMWASIKVMFDAPRVRDGLDDVVKAFKAWQMYHPHEDPHHWFIEHPEHVPHMGSILPHRGVEVSIFRDGRLWYNRPIFDVKPHRCPRHNRAIYWGVEVRTRIPVWEIHLQNSHVDLVQEGGHA